MLYYEDPDPFEKCYHKGCEKKARHRGYCKLHAWERQQLEDEAKLRTQYYQSQILALSNEPDEIQTNQIQPPPPQPNEIQTNQIEPPPPRVVLCSALYCNFEGCNERAVYRGYCHHHAWQIFPS